MDELKQNWDAIKFDSSIEESEAKGAIRQSSKSPLASIQKQLLIKVIFTFAMVPVIAFGIFWSEVVINTWILSFLLIMHLSLGTWMLIKWNRLKEPIKSIDLLDHLSAYRTSVLTVIRIEELTGIFLYPFSLTSGMLIGLQLTGSEYTFGSDKFWLWWTITMIVFTPLLHFFTKWLNKLALGKFLDQLTDNIKELTG